MAKNPTLWLVVLGLLCLVPSTSPTPFPTTKPEHALFPRAEEKLECQTARAPDYYGLGVRLGIYFTWLQGYVANTMLPSEISGALDTNTVFLLTLLVAMIKCASVDMLEQIDGLVLVHLSSGSVFGVLSIWGYRTCHYRNEGPSGIRHFGGFGTHARLILSLGVSIFSLWFWMFGVTGALSPMGPEDDPPNDPACAELFTFMFAKVSATGGVRIFYIIMWISMIIYFGIMLIVSSLAGYARASKIAKLAKTRQWAVSSRLRFATGFNFGE